MITTQIQNLAVYALAALAEIAGCFAVWAWLRRDGSIWWLVPGIMALFVFAWLLTRIDVEFAGRAYAAYGGIYIVASLGWLWLAENTRPTMWDLGGASLAVAGTLVILMGAQISR